MTVMLLLRDVVAGRAELTPRSDPHVQDLLRRMNFPPQTTHV